MARSVKNLFFLIFPVLIGIVIGFVFQAVGFSIAESSLVQICTGGLITFSLTSGVLLITMPRSQNKYLEKLDSDGRIFGYVASMATPGLLALLSAVFAGSTLDGQKTFGSFREIKMYFDMISQPLFWASLTSLFWALWVLKQLIDNANYSGKIP